MRIGTRVAHTLTCACAVLGICLAVHADEKGDELRKQVRTAEKTAKTLSADYSVETVFGKTKTSEGGTVSLKKPLMVKMVQKGAAKSGLYSDGKHYVITAQGRQFAHGDASLKSLEGQPAPIMLFFGPGANADAMLAGAKSVRLVGAEVIDGVKCDVFELLIKELDMTVRLTANPDHLIVRSIVTMKPDGETLSVQTCTLKNVKVNGEIPDATFGLPK